jgi:hypothetical protein
MPRLRFCPRPETKLLFSLALPVVFAGCLGYAERPRDDHMRARQPVRLSPVIVEQEDYVYYPGYQVYYGSRSHQYYYQDGPVWVARPAPRIAVNVLLSSPSVGMDFHDAPASHHAQVVQTYPQAWTKSHDNNGRKPGPRDQRKDDDK